MTLENKKFYDNQFRELKFDLIHFKKIKRCIKKFFILDGGGITDSIKIKRREKPYQKIKKVLLKLQKYQNIDSNNKKPRRILEKKIRIVFISIILILITFMFLGFYYLYFFIIYSLIIFIITTFFSTFFIKSKKSFKSLEFTGIGAKSFPIILKDIKENEYQLRIERSKLFIFIKNIRSNELIIKKCENVNIENCIFNDLTLKKSSKLRIENCQIKKNLYLYQCNNNILSKNNINLFDIDLSFENQIVKSKIKQIHSNFSINNNFIEIDTNRFNLKNLNKKFEYKSNHLLFPIFLFIIIFGFIFLTLCILGMSIFLSFICSILFTFSCTIVMSPLLVVFYRESKGKKKILQLRSNNELISN